MPRLSAHKRDDKSRPAAGASSGELTSSSTSELRASRDGTAAGRQGGRAKSASSLLSPVFPAPETRPPKPALVDRLIQTILLLAVGLTPLIFSQRTTELFEFPKMAFVYILAVAAAWLLVIKWLQQKRPILIFTPLNWPIAIFLTWLLITALTGLHFYTSIAGYYTRFNGGLASYVAYAVLFYALVDQLAEGGERMEDGGINSQNGQIKNALYRFFVHRGGPQRRAPEDCDAHNSGGASCETPAAIAHNYKSNGPAFLSQLLWSWLLGALIVSIWGILEHFGHDPSCIILRGTFTANCWVEDVQARVFSTFGQPNWLATYLVATIPLGLALNLISTSKLAKWLSAIVTILCYAAFWYTYSRSGWFGLITALILLALAIPWKTVWSQRFWLGGIILVCLIISISSFNGAALRAETALSGRGDDSSTGSIRLLVWQGTLSLIKDHPILGTGPETFAYAFPAYRPVAANMTTEWNFLYNEAHNQALNTTATTGIPGLLLWLSLFAVPIWLLWKANTFINLNWLKRKPAAGASYADFLMPRNIELTSSEKTQVDREWETGGGRAGIWAAAGSVLHRFLDRQNTGVAPPEKLPTIGLGLSETSSLLPPAFSLLSAALMAGIIGVFVSQLFGFAVVVTNLLFFIALAIIAAPWAQKLEEGWKMEEADGGSYHIANIPQSSILRLPSKRFRISNFVFLLLTLILLATSYLLYNYISSELLIKQADTETSANPGQAIYDYQTAINRNPFEPNYRLKLAAAQINAATTNTRSQFYSQANQQLQAAQQLNPHDLIIAKSIAYFYRTMASVDSSYKFKALQAAQRSVDLAPTDADAVRTLADIQKDLGNPNDALKNYSKLIQLRPTADSYLARASYFKQFGPTDRFQQDIQTVLKMDPNYQAAKQLLQE